MTDTSTSRKTRQRRTVIKDGPRPVDVHVGSRIRLRRNLLGMSQTEMGEAVGLTFQQIQKYERGMNRVGASRLYQLSRVLDVPVSFFFDDMPDEIRGEFGAMPGAKVSAGYESSHGGMSRRETRLIANLRKLPEEMQEAFINLVAAAARDEAAGDAD